jgi:type II secretory pathway component GspD/PulD (secretin)
LEYVVSLSSFTGAAANSNVPPPSQENRVESQVTIPDGSTIVVGGLNTSNASKAIDKVPLLGDIPGLGALFSRQRDSNSNSTLFVFIRPVILRDDQFADLKYLSIDEVRRANLPGDHPVSEPALMR